MAQMVVGLKCGYCGYFGGYGRLNAYALSVR